MSGKKIRVTRLTSPPQATAADSLAVLAALSGAMAILTLSPTGIILAANDNVMTRTRLSPKQLRQQPYRLVFPPGKAASDDAMWARIAAGQCQSECIACHAVNGMTTWIDAIYVPVINHHGELAQIIVLQSDATARKMQEILQYKALDAMARDVGLPRTMALVCQEIDDLTPEIVSSAYRLDDQQQLLCLAGPTLPQGYHDIATALMARTAGTPSQTFYIDQHVAFTGLKPDPLWENHTHRFISTGVCAAWMTPVHAANGQTSGLLVLYCFEQQPPGVFHQQLIDLVIPVFALALERETSRSRIERLAYYDALTGLANRSMITYQASLAIDTASSTDSSVAVLFIDLDRFKQVNDALGHHAGDELLRTIAARLTSVARKTDIVGRLSGDEFVVILVNCQRDYITDIATRIQQTLATPCHINGVPITPSASIGISIFPDNGNTIDILLHRADLAMYTAKERRRGSFGFFSDAMNDQTQDTLAMEAALRTAITNRELVLYYQPQVHLQAHRLYGVEALARWKHKEWGLIAPERFIAVAEACGLIGALGQWVLEEACRQLAHWRAQHIDVPGIAVNLSASNFHDHTLAATISGLLDQYQLPAHCMTLEITETVLMDTNPDTTNNIRAIHALGVRFAIDDFGTGYSSLGYLRNLPVCALKLDQTFVRDIGTDPTVLALANAVIRIGESLGLTVIAEGVEDADQYALLQDSLCDVAQGYLFSPPLPANAVAAWVHDFASGQLTIAKPSQRPLL